MTTEKAINRLFTEWKEHGRIIIGLDYDDTISPWRAATQEDCDKVINLVKLAKSTGAYVVIHTACNPDRYDEIKSYCASKGLELDGINTTPLPLPYGHNTKIYANIFLDDRAGLSESLGILEKAMYKMRGFINEHNVLNQQF